jgi:hypothetical protein
MMLSCTLGLNVVESFPIFVLYWVYNPRNVNFMATVMIISETDGLAWGWIEALSSPISKSYVIGLTIPHIILYGLKRQPKMLKNIIG